ncbi:hypothetical protein A2U01_0096488, partial [Trifolium medium]|nr:hypothetical protein [Trifolium medium]
NAKGMYPSLTAEMTIGFTEHTLSSSSNFLFMDPMVVLLNPPPVITRDLGKFSHDSSMWA